MRTKEKPPVLAKRRRAGSDRIDKAFDDTLHFLSASGIMGFPENGLLLLLRHCGVGIQSRFVHGKGHAKANGYFRKVHDSFLLYPAAASMFPMKIP